MARFLFKTEPSSYSFADLERERRAVWDGVSNPLALRHLATMRKGDSVVIYHTGDEKQAVGLAVATSDPHPDPKLKDPKRLFNSSLEGNVRRAIDLHEGEQIDETAFKALVREAVALNESKSRKPARGK